jgi:hypothetical protein
MHLVIAVLFAFALSTATSAKILGIAGAVYAVLQVAKKIFPALSGWWALGLNIALSVAAVLVTVTPENLFSVDTLVAVLTAIAASAGIHGTVKNLSAPASPAAPSAPAAS